MLFQFLINVKNLRARCVKSGEKLATNDENINLTIDKLVLDRILIVIRVAVLCHHLIPESNDHIVSAFVYLFAAFTHIGCRDNNSCGQVTKLFKTFLITNGILFEVTSQHCFEAGVFVTFDKVLVYIQRNTLDTCIGRSQALNGAPLVLQIYLLCVVELLGDLIEPKIDICFIYVLFNKLTFIDQRYDCLIIHTVFDGILMD